MRMTEEQLEAHLKAHEMRKNSTKQRIKSENDAKVRQANKVLNTANNSELQIGEVTPILECEVSLIPPTVNHYWAKSGKGYKLSDKAREFHGVVAMLVPALKTEARLKLDVTFHFPNRLRRDIDNYLKATIDSLVKCGLCVDDEQFDTLVVNRGHVVKGGLLKIKVSELGK